MATYLIFTKLGTESYESPKQFRDLAEKVAARIRAECPAVQWKDSYAVMGRFDGVDVGEAAGAAPRHARDDARDTVEGVPAGPVGRAGSREVELSSPSPGRQDRRSSST